MFNDVTFSALMSADCGIVEFVFRWVATFVAHGLTYADRMAIITSFTRDRLLFGLGSGELMTMMGDKFGGGVAMVSWILNQHGKSTLVAIAESSLDLFLTLISR